MSDVWKDKIINDVLEKLPEDDPTRVKAYESLWTEYLSKPHQAARIAFVQLYKSLQRMLEKKYLSETDSFEKARLESYLRELRSDPSLLK